MPAATTPAIPAKAVPADAEQPAPRRGMIGRILRPLLWTIGLLSVAALLFAAGLAAGWFYFGRPGSPVLDALRALKPADPATEAIAEGEGGKDTHAEEKPEKVAKPAPEAEEFLTTYYSFEEPMTSNLAGSRRFLQVTIALSTQYDAKVMSNVEKNKVALQSDMLSVISTFTQEDLTGIQGRERLANALRDAINKRLLALEDFGGVDAVWFPTFVMQ